MRNLLLISLVIVLSCARSPKPPFLAIDAIDSLVVLQDYEGAFLVYSNYLENNVSIHLHPSHALKIFSYNDEVELYKKALKRFIVLGGDREEIWKLTSSDFVLDNHKVVKAYMIS